MCLIMKSYRLILTLVMVNWFLRKLWPLDLEKLQIKLDYGNSWMIFTEVTALGLRKFQWIYSFPHFFLLRGHWYAVLLLIYIYSILLDRFCLLLLPCQCGCFFLSDMVDYTIIYFIFVYSQVGLDYFDFTIYVICFREFVRQIFVW